jgi:hypothetical protein
MEESQIYPSPFPSPLRGEGKGEGRLGHLDLVFGAYLGFVIWDLVIMKPPKIINRQFEAAGWAQREL